MVLSFHGINKSGPHFIFTFNTIISLLNETWNIKWKKKFVSNWSRKENVAGKKRVIRGRVCIYETHSQRMHIKV